MTFEPDPSLIVQAIERQRELEARAADVELSAELVERARQVLIPAARSGQRMSHAQFAAQLNVPDIEGTTCDPLLVRLAESEAEAGRPLLSVIVVNSHNRRPSAALCELAREVRQWDCDDEEAYLKELSLVSEYWRPV